MITTEKMTRIENNELLNEKNNNSASQLQLRLVIHSYPPPYPSGGPVVGMLIFLILSLHRKM